MAEDQNNKIYDLEERTALFSQNLIRMCKSLPQNVITIPIISQLIRAGTSIGANYCEANGASSKKDFKNKIFICKKEAKETQYWLRNLTVAVDDDKVKAECQKLWQEARELTLIFSKIALNTR